MWLIAPFGCLNNFYFRILSNFLGSLHFSCYKALIALRKSSPALSRGDLEIPETGSDTLFALKRSYNGETLLSFHNFSAEPSKIPAALVPQNGEVLLSSYDREGGYIGPNLRPYESVVFRV